MVSRMLARRANGEKGFTLLELLVVVIIIGILAAVSIPIYMNQRTKARNSTAQQDVKNAQLAIESALVDTGGATNYMHSITCVGMGGSSKGTIIEPDGTTSNFTCSTDVTVMVDFDPYGNNYTITGWHKGGDKEYFFDSALGSLTTKEYRA